MGPKLVNQRSSISVSIPVITGLEKTAAKLQEMTGVKCSLSKVIEYLLAVEDGKVHAIR